MHPSLPVFGLLALLLGAFVLGRPRYDVAAVLILLVAVVAGVVPVGEAFAGFGHPAVVTIAAMLIISRGLTRAGIVDVIVGLLGRIGSRFTVQAGALNGFVATLSAFMNNVGAVALLIPAGIRVAREHGRSPGQVLMPIAFASLLGGLVTLIGTPPNIIVATFRPGEPFGMFDFAPVGLVLAVAGAAFISLVGWRLMPDRGHGSTEEVFQIRDYTTEVLVPDGSDAVGKTVRELGVESQADVVVVGVVRAEKRRIMPSPYEPIRAGDGLVVEGSSDELDRFMTSLGLEMFAEEPGEEGLRSDDITVAEAIVMAQSPLVGRTPAQFRLRQRHDVNLLAVARQGARLTRRLADIRFRGGDVLLLQARKESLPETLAHLRCLPLEGTRVPFGPRSGLWRAVLLFAVAIALTTAGVLPVEIAFSAVAALYVLLRVVPLDEVYTSVEWPVVFLLAAILPVAGALETSGGTGLISGLLLRMGDGLAAPALLALVLAVTMLLANVVNKAAAVIMAPIAVALAHDLGVSADPLLMAVAVGATCAFLTPVGHQANMLVLGPGGYQFGDYWKLGLPLTALVLVLAVPLILVFWPL